jgi:hypothetical protein
MLRLFYPLLFIFPYFFCILTLILRFDAAVRWLEFEKSWIALTAYSTATATTDTDTDADAGNGFSRSTFSFGEETLEFC